MHMALRDADIHVHVPLSASDRLQQHISRGRTVCQLCAAVRRPLMIHSVSGGTPIVTSSVVDERRKLAVFDELPVRTAELLPDAQ